MTSLCHTLHTSLMWTKTRLAEDVLFRLHPMFRQKIPIGGLPEDKHGSFCPRLQSCSDLPEDVCLFLIKNTSGLHDVEIKTFIFVFNTQEVVCFVTMDTCGRQLKFGSTAAPPSVQAAALHGDMRRFFMFWSLQDAFFSQH